MSRVFIVGDLHLPFTHKNYLRFCKKVYKQYKCNKVVFIGDIVDHHNISYHESNPDGISPGDELKLAQRDIKPWVKAFPRAVVTKGNHDILPTRKATTYGIPHYMIKDLGHIYETDRWVWGQSFEIDKVQYTHGKGVGINAALKTAMADRVSTVQGHAHAWAGVQFSTSIKDRIFGMNVGCGIDIDAYVFEYGKNFSARPVLGCGVVLEGLQPIFVPMILGE